MLLSISIGAPAARSGHSVLPASQLRAFPGRHSAVRDQGHAGENHTRLWVMRAVGVGLSRTPLSVCIGLAPSGSAPTRSREQQTLDEIWLKGCHDSIERGTANDAMLSRIIGDNRRRGLASRHSFPAGMIIVHTRRILLSGLSTRSLTVCSQCTCSCNRKEWRGRPHCGPARGEVTGATLSMETPRSSPGYRHQAAWKTITDEDVGIIKDRVVIHRVSALGLDAH